MFIGTHNFHNYTIGMKSKNPKAMRYIISFGCTMFERDMAKF